MNYIHCDETESMFELKYTKKASTHLLLKSHTFIEYEANTSNFKGRNDLTGRRN